MCLSTSLSLIWELFTDSCLCTRHSARPWGTSSLASPHPHRGHIPEEWIQGPWAGRRTLVKSQACPRLKRGLHLARQSCFLREVWLEGSNFSGHCGEERILSGSLCRRWHFSHGLGVSRSSQTLVHSCALTVPRKACAMWGIWRNLLGPCFLC